MRPLLRLLSPLVAVVAFVAFAACAARDDTTPVLVVEFQPSPTGPGAAEPNLFTTADGRVILSWLEPVDGTAHALRFAVRGSDGAWSEPREVLRRRDLFVNWADFPSVVALSDGRLLAHWLQRNGPGASAYEVRLSESRDGGTTWSPSVAPHTPGVQAEHGFATILPDAAGGAQIFFLDGGANRPSRGATVGGHSHSIPMSLAVNHWVAGIGDATKTLLDSRVCDCCQTAAATTARGPVVAYRDRSDDEVRDIAIVRRVNGAWTAPARVHADDWRLRACPVNGPAIVARGDTVAVAWFTGARDTAKVLVAFSTDAGANFGLPTRVDGGAPGGRVGLQWMAGAAYVSWHERNAGRDAAVLLRRVRPDGVADSVITVSETASGRASGFPRLTGITDGLLMAWTVPGPPGTPSDVRVATVRAEAR